MARVTVEDCVCKVESAFELVHVATLRARQLQRGSRMRVECSEEKPPVIALREIAAGAVAVDWDNPARSRIEGRGRGAAAAQRCLTAPERSPSETLETEIDGTAVATFKPSPSAAAAKGPSLDAEMEATLKAAQKEAAED